MGSISQFTPFEIGIPARQGVSWGVTSALCCLHKNATGSERLAVNTGGKPSLRDM